jgi:hypothetical protein
MKRLVIATILVLSAAASAGAETYVYKDTLRPNGHERDMAAKKADARSCGAINWTVRHDWPEFNQCMQTHDWVVGYVKPNTPDGVDDTTVVHFDDVLKPHGRYRGDGAMRADSQRCDPYGTTNYRSGDFKQCMLGFGWQYSHTYHPAD